jgi:hypothetical protein
LSHAFIVLVGACLAMTGCVPDSAHRAIFLPAPYDSLPPAPPGTRIEPGVAIGLDARQQEAVVVGVTQWMKDPSSVQFGAMDGVRNRAGTITVCGRVNGRNSAGSYTGMAPFVGVLLRGTAATPLFVVVGIGSSERERAEVTSLCRESGIPQDRLRG